MPKYYGCPCEGCGARMTLRDDIVVCPDCVAPYHRTCSKSWAAVSRCLPIPPGYEWKFPYQDSELRTCPPAGGAPCGQRPTAAAAAPAPPEATAEPNDRAAAESERTAPLTTTVCTQQFEQAGPAADPCAKAGRPPLARKIRWTGILQ